MSENHPKVSKFEHDAISIVAGGWSFIEVDQAKLPGKVIAVNGAARHLTRRPDVIVTMDRLWLEHEWEWLRDLNAGDNMIPVHARDHAAKNLAITERLVSDAWLRIFKNDNSGEVAMSRVAGVLNGSNSGACAMNLAFLSWPKQVYLFGFDMGLSKQGNAYWYQPYAWAKRSGSGTTKLSRWAQQFDLWAIQFAKAGIKLTNVSSGSLINPKIIKRIKPQDLGVAK